MSGDDFQVDISLALPGRKASPLTAELVRELTEADLAVSRSDPIKPPPLKRLRDSHHSLARSLASGLSPAECHLLTGYSPSRISILQDDPAFKELLQFYREKAEGERNVVTDRFTSFMMDNLSLLEEKLDSEPDKITAAEARENIKMAGAIAGFTGKTGGNTLNVNIGFADRLAEARKRASMASGLDAPGPVIEAKALPRPVERPSGEVASPAAPATSPLIPEEVE